MVESNELKLLRELRKCQEELKTSQDSWDYVELNNLIKELRDKIYLDFTDSDRDWERIQAFLRGRMLPTSEELYSIGNIIVNIADILKEKENCRKNMSALENRISEIKCELGIQ